jgi:ribosomal protein S18 acetylase RimI-like enzyme
MRTTILCVREYCATDRDSCLAVFDSNVPSSFLDHERPLFAAYLDDLPGPYLVLEDRDGKVVACGGYAVGRGTASADLCWGMVRLERQGLGLGRLLTELRIRRIREDPALSEVAMNTSQHTRAFYERLGFVTERVTTDGFAPGLDRCDMRLDLQQNS